MSMFAAVSPSPQWPSLRSGRGQMDIAISRALSVPDMTVRTSRVTCTDPRGTEHTIEISALAFGRAGPAYLPRRCLVRRSLAERRQPRRQDQPAGRRAPGPYQGFHQLVGSAGKSPAEMAKYRLLSANEENGNYFVTAFMGFSAPTGDDGNSNSKLPKLLPPAIVGLKSRLRDILSK